MGCYEKASGKPAGFSFYHVITIYLTGESLTISTP